MKRNLFLSAILPFSLAVALCACGSTPGESTPSEKTQSSVSQAQTDSAATGNEISIGNNFSIEAGTVLSDGSIYFVGREGADGLLWKALFTQNGILNNLLSFWGVPEISFLDSSAAFGVLVGTYLWRNIGYDMILWLAGLDAIPASMYEAAEVDGANSWQIFWKITLPNLPSTMGLITILSILNTFKVYREAYLVAGNYPDDSIYLLQHLFNNWFSSLDLGRLSAAAVVVALALLLVILPFLKMLREGSE